MTLTAEDAAKQIRRERRYLFQAGKEATRAEVSADVYEKLADWVSSFSDAPQPNWPPKGDEHPRIWGMPMFIVDGENIARTVCVEISGWVRYDGHVPMMRWTVDNPRGEAIGVPIS